MAICSNDPTVTSGNGITGRPVWPWSTSQSDACAWYASKLKALVAMGVDCFKTDFGERIPTDVVY